MEYTKGEWKIKRFDTICSASIFASGECVADIISDVEDGPTLDESLANANLIAAAPDMYEALKATEYTMSVDPSELMEHPITASMVREAIAKAEGKVS